MSPIITRTTADAKGRNHHSVADIPGIHEAVERHRNDPLMLTDNDRDHYDCEKKRRPQTPKQTSDNPPRDIDADHWKKLRGSGLSLATVEAAGIHTEHDTGTLRVLLRGILALAPAMIFPYFDRDGRRIKYSIARPTIPHRFPDGREAKYLMPRGCGNQTYIPPFASVLEALNTPGKLLLITEGILKALAATQAGVPCLGLMGTWNWQVGGSKPRELIEDLAGIKWQDRPVAIVFDFDRVRKPNVRHAEAELARADRVRSGRVYSPLGTGPAWPEWKADEAGD